MTAVGEMDLSSPAVAAGAFRGYQGTTGYGTRAWKADRLCPKMLDILVVYACVPVRFRACVCVPPCLCLHPQKIDAPAPAYP